MSPGAEEEQQLNGAAHSRGPLSLQRYLHRYRRGRHMAGTLVLYRMYRLYRLYRRGRHLAGTPFRLAVVGPATTRTRVTAAAAIAITAAGLAALLSSSAAPAGPVTGVALMADTGRTAGGGGVSRDYQRGSLPWAGHPRAVAPSKAAPSRAPSSAPPPSAAAPAAPSPTTHAPVGGLSQAEMDNAVAIIEAGQQMGLPPRAYVVAISTALQESHLRVLANPNVPGSTDHPNEGVGYDHDSIGLFQQRPSWGSVEQLMDPHESARRFYARLVTIPDWAQMAVTVAAQTVQVSAFPDAYAKWQPLAEQVVGAVA
ncbi:hypothetical protein ACFFX1_20185 [Dactylosporangium sucinum]|uniref:Peptidase M23 n=1 Tax=Dactylosporangium sucinum TaxID=1424081 RepID=A0A917X112_9ACTN|nr:hypothetical protein [Dactylosporangium sucinum]GGM50019.1 hypothetical protein GCM10007977_059640 [Dactylosporangium sucinum]